MHSSLYPFRFQPIVKEKIWGGTRIARLLGRDTGPMPRCGESWEVSGLVDDESVVTNGFLAENNLNELLEIYLTDLVGEENYEKYGLGFPLLIKYIDAQDNLSVQVHPDDELAQKEYGQNGKTEMWHVLDAEPGSGLYIGFKEKLTLEQIENAVNSGALAELLRFYPVSPGDTFMIPAGTVHAIGKGVLLAEIQQPSDITFRLFDWNRVDDEGRSRELHVEEALKAIRLEENLGEFKKAYEPKKNASISLVRSQYFNVGRLDLDQPWTKNLVTLDSFVIYMCIDGKADMRFDGGSETMNKGDVLLVPADMQEITLVPAPAASLLEIYC